MKYIKTEEGYWGIVLLVRSQHWCKRGKIVLERQEVSEKAKQKRKVKNLH